MATTDLLEYTYDELKEQLAGMGYPGYRADQIYAWMHKRLVNDLSQMSDLPQKMRQELDGAFRICAPEIAARQISSEDGTRKYALRFEDGNVIETVMMKYEYGVSVCVSSQAGCRMGCRFCASTLSGLSRSLTAAEMLSQVYTVQRDTGLRVSHVVIMGSGEPLDNFDETLRFIGMLADPKGTQISMRNITLSTCGLVPAIDRLAACRLPITLAISLHASNQADREKIMPVARMYSLEELIPCVRRYQAVTGRRVSFEYTLIRGVNDDEDHAAELAGLLKGLHAHVNLIPLNPVNERSFSSPERNRVRGFQKRLEELGQNATVRRSLGRDIDSACGQLRRRFTDA